MSTKIQWTNETVNFATGCTRVSPGCDNCYMMASYNRWKGLGNKGYQADGQTVTLHLDRLDRLEESLRSWRQPRKVFINSMADTFHRDVPFELAERLLTMFAQHPQHTAQLLTKRPGLMAYFAREVWAPRPWPPNVWAGTSVESQKYAPRLDVLARVPAAIRFVSAEPLLGPLNLRKWLKPQCSRRDGSRDTSYEESVLEWVIIGGESGPNSRPLHVAWARDLIKQCADANVPCFLKQLGRRPEGLSAGVEGRSHVKLDAKGGDWNEWPEDLRVRDFPSNSGWGDYEAAPQNDS